MGTTRYTRAEINLQVVVAASAVPVRQTTEMVTTNRCAVYTAVYPQQDLRGGQPKTFPEAGFRLKTLHNSCNLILSQLPGR
jgi:hypothetical protein